MVDRRVLRVLLWRIFRSRWRFKSSAKRISHNCIYVGRTGCDDYGVGVVVAVSFERKFDVGAVGVFPIDSVKLRCGAA